tara:strand:- start:585 stop:743 length:159 start_codon:yes stop_codon:yes gene_type:complete
MTSSMRCFSEQLNSGSSQFSRLSNEIEQMLGKLVVIVGSYTVGFSDFRNLGN